MRYVDLLPKLDPSQATIVKDFCCPTCDKTGIEYGNRDKPTLVGWTDTDWGFMMVVECTHCFTKWCFHGSSGWKNQHDLNALEHTIRLYIEAEYFENSKELKEKNED